MRSSRPSWKTTCAPIRRDRRAMRKRRRLPRITLRVNRFFVPSRADASSETMMKTHCWRRYGRPVCRRRKGREGRREEVDTPAGSEAERQEIAMMDIEEERSRSGPGKLAVTGLRLKTDIQNDASSSSSSSSSPLPCQHEASSISQVYGRCLVRRISIRRTSRKR